MANPTTYFGWVMPTATDLVTDLPADFNVFGQGVDTSLQDLLGGTTGQVLAKNSNTNMDFIWTTPTDQTPLTTKGDLFTFTTVDARLGVGTNGQVLTADSTASTGLAWATSASGGMTSIASGSLSGSSLVLSSIVGTYKNLQLVVRDLYGSSNADLRLTFNSITDYDFGQFDNRNGTASNNAYIAQTSIIPNYYNLSGSDNNNSLIVNIYDYANTSAFKLMDSQIAYKNVDNVRELTKSWGVAKATAAVTSVTLALSLGTYSGGTYELFGVK